MAQEPFVPEGWRMLRAGPAHPRADDEPTPAIEFLMRHVSDDIQVEVLSNTTDDQPRIELLVRQNLGPYPAITGLRWTPRDGLAGDDEKQDIWLTLYGEYVEPLGDMCSRNWGLGPAPQRRPDPFED